MTIHTNPRQRRTAMLLAALFVIISSGQAVARDVTRSGSYVTGKGRTGSYSSEVRGNRRDGLTRSQSITTRSGRTVNRSATTTYDRESGTFNRSVTGANGTTRSVTGSASDGVRSGTYTTSGGRTGSFSGDLRRNDDGSLTRNLSVTNQDGETFDRSTTYSYDRDTKTLQRSVTRPSGDTRSGSVTFIPEQP